jgi:hypothetical protein
MPVMLTMRDPFSGNPYTISKENLLALLVLDTARLTFEGQVVAALHAEIARASRACESEAMYAEIAYRKWKATHAMAMRSGETKMTEKAIEESYRVKAEYEEMSSAPERWNLLARLFADLRDSVRLKAEMIKAHERSLDERTRAEPSESLDRLEDYVREAHAKEAPTWAAPTGAASPPTAVAEEAKKRLRKPRKENE